jgi:hypothetical protein
MIFKKSDLLKKLAVGFVSLCVLSTNAKADKTGEAIAISIGTAGIVPALVGIPALAKSAKCNSGCDKKFGAEFSIQYFTLSEDKINASKDLKSKIDKFSACLSKCSADSTKNFRCNVFNQIENKLHVIQAAIYMKNSAVDAFGLSKDTADYSDNILRDFLGFDQKEILTKCKAALVGKEKHLSRNLGLAREVVKSLDQGYEVLEKYKKESDEKPETTEEE